MPTTIEQHNASAPTSVLRVAASADILNDVIIRRRAL